MSNTSATGGYLLPVDTALPIDDEQLEAVFQSLVVGLTAIPGALVRPRWQPVTPIQPEPSVNWCALGVTVQDNDAGPAITHSAAGQGSDTYQRHQRIEVLCTFYGPRGKHYAQLLADGLAMPQNQEPLTPFGIRFIDAGPVRTVSTFVNQGAIRRYDVTLTFRRKITRSYPVLNLLSATVLPESGSPIEITDP